MRCRDRTRAAGGHDQRFIERRPTPCRDSGVKADDGRVWAHDVPALLVLLQESLAGHDNVRRGRKNGSRNESGQTHASASKAVHFAISNYPQFTDILSSSLLPSTPASRNRKGVHRLFKVRQYCAFATANLLAPRKDENDEGQDDTDDDELLRSPYYAFCQVAEAVSLMLDHIYPSSHPHPLSPEDASEEARKTEEQREEEHANLQHQDKEVGEDLRLEAAYALGRILRDGCSFVRCVAYQTVAVNEGLPRIINRLRQQAEAIGEEIRKAPGGRLEGDGPHEWPRDREIEGGISGRDGGQDCGDSNRKEGAGVEGFAKKLTPPRCHAGLVLALLECLNTLIFAALPFPRPSSTTTACSSAAATATATSAANEDETGVDDDEEEAEVNPAPALAVTATSETRAAGLRLYHRLTVARMLDRMMMPQEPAGSSSACKKIDPFLLKTGDEEVEREVERFSGAFERAVSPVLAALKGKVASTSVKRRLRRLALVKVKIVEMMAAVSDGKGQEKETD